MPLTKTPHLAETVRKLLARGAGPNAFNIIHRLHPVDIAELLSELPNYIDEYIINGHSAETLPNLISMSVKYIEGESVVLMLDDEKIAVSTQMPGRIRALTKARPSPSVQPRLRI